jgi:hypothetical protein
MPESYATLPRRVKSAGKLIARKLVTPPFSRKEQVVVIDVGNAHNQDPHAADGSVDDAGRDVDQGALADGVLDAVKAYGHLPLQDDECLITPKRSQIEAANTAVSRISG